MSDKDNVFSISKKRQDNYLKSEEGQDALANAFDAIQAKANERPLSFEEKDNKRGYCQWRATVLKEKIAKGYLSQPASIEHERDSLADEIMSVRSDWSSAQWREFVDRGGDIPATTYASDRDDVNSYIDDLREEWKDKISQMRSDGVEFDIMEEKRSLESDIFDIENLSLKHWNEREAVQELVSKVFNSPIVNRIQGMFDSGVDAMRTIAMVNIRNLYNNNQIDECNEAVNIGVEGGHLTEFEASSLRKGKIPMSDIENNTGHDEPEI